MFNYAHDTPQRGWNTQHQLNTSSCFIRVIYIYITASAWALLRDSTLLDPSHKPLPNATWCQGYTPTHQTLTKSDASESDAMKQQDDFINSNQPLPSNIPTTSTDCRPPLPAYEDMRLIVESGILTKCNTYLCPEDKYIRELRDNNKSVD